MRKALLLSLGVVTAAVLATGCTMKDESSESTDSKQSTVDSSTDGTTVGGAKMVRNLDIVDNAKNAKNVTTVVSAVGAAGLVDTLKGPGPFTVFAPNNGAFEKLPAGTVDTLLKPENKPMLTKILTYHVVAGAFPSSALKDGQKLKTVQGGEITIGKQGDKITVNGANVETSDVISSNGVTYVIDSVMQPQ